MLKNKTTNQLISGSIVAGLLISMLPISLSLHGQSFPGETIQQAAQRERLKKEVKQKISQIKSINWRLKTAQIAIPGLIIGGILAGLAVAFIPLLIALVTLLGASERLKRVNKLLLEFSFGTSSGVSMAESKVKIPIQMDIASLDKKKVFQPLEKELRKFLGKDTLTSELSAKLKQLGSLISKIDYEGYKRKKGLFEIFKKNEDNFMVYLKNRETSLKRSLKATGVLSLILGSFGSVIIQVLAFVLFLATDIAAAIVKKTFGLSTDSVSKAFRNAEEIKQLEQDKLITLTSDQKAVIATLEKRQTSPIIKGVIKNLRLGDIQTKLVNEAVQTHSSIVAKPGDTQKKREKRARKLFAKYIKARWEEGKLKKQAAKLFAAQEKDVAKIKASNAKQLEKMKRKIEKLDDQYPGLRAALSKEVEAYATEADKILEELKKDIMKAIGVEEVTPQTVAPMVQL